MPVSAKDINGTPDMFSGRNSVAIRVWVLVAFVVGLGAVMAAMALMITQYTQRSDDKSPTTTWPGLAMLLQSLLIFMSGLVYRFAGDAVGVPEYDAF